MATSASDVRDLRERTGAGMMDCKKALDESGGDLEKAVEWLRVKGMAKAAKRSGKIASEGLVHFAIAADGKSGALVEVNCETDFVARNVDFRNFVDTIAKLALTNKTTTVEALAAVPFEDSTLDVVRLARIGTTGENINIRRVAFYELAGPGRIGGYIHAEGKIGVIAVAEAGTELDDARFTQLAKEISLHVCACSPIAVSDNDIDPAILAAEKAVYEQQAQESGKPPEIAEKMALGRLSKWKKEICMLDQAWVTNADITVEAHLAAMSKELGTPIKIAGFTRFARGEGIEKEETDFAAEVAAALL